MDNAFAKTWTTLADAVDAALERYLPAAGVPPGTIHRAMRYSVFAGGKRLRPVLCLLAGKVVGGRRSTLMPAACALEMVHTYSLVHDDLPAMDDDDYRRGKPTAHRKFGEAIAVLSGDALLTLAFGTVALHTRDKATAARLCAELAGAAGTAGMVGGQVFDVEGEGKRPDRGRVEEIHRRKTAALIRASVRMGAIAAGAKAPELRALSTFGEATGLLFQITDDLLDETGDARSMGKRLKKDAVQGKQTYPRAFGIDRAREIARAEAERAERALERFGERAAMLRAVPRFVLERKK
jgi:geranylgeranyl diphosphate synthase type II